MMCVIVNARINAANEIIIFFLTKSKLVKRNKQIFVW